MTTETIRAPRAIPGLERITGFVAMIAVAGILSGAVIVVGDVLARWLLGTAIVALNEIMSSVFAVAVAATLPAGASRRVNLSIDLLGAMTGPRMTAWLTFIGSLLLAAFFGLLAWRMSVLGLRYAAPTSLILRQFSSPPPISPSAASSPSPRWCSWRMRPRIGSAPAARPRVEARGPW